MNIESGNPYKNIKGLTNGNILSFADHTEEKLTVPFCYLRDDDTLKNLIINNKIDDFVSLIPFLRKLGKLHSDSVPHHQKPNIMRTLTLLALLTKKHFTQKVEGQEVRVHALKDLVMVWRRYSQEIPRGFVITQLQEIIDNLKPDALQGDDVQYCVLNLYALSKLLELLIEYRGEHRVLGISDELIDKMKRNLSSIGKIDSNLNLDLTFILNCCQREIDKLGSDSIKDVCINLTVQAIKEPQLFLNAIPEILNSVIFSDYWFDTVHEIKKMERDLLRTLGDEDIERLNCLLDSCDTIKKLDWRILYQLAESMGAVAERHTSLVVQKVAVARLCQLQKTFATKTIYDREMAIVDKRPYKLALDRKCMSVFKEVESLRNYVSEYKIQPGQEVEVPNKYVAAISKTWRDAEWYERTICIGGTIFAANYVYQKLKK